MSQEIVIIVIGLAIVILFLAMSVMRQSEDKIASQRASAEADKERAKAEREASAKTLAIKSASERTLTLEHARQQTHAGILKANLDQKNKLLRLIESDGGFAISFSDGQNSYDKGSPRISWKWAPFENAIIKIYRNTGTILEDPTRVLKEASLIHIEPKSPSGSYLDQEARVNTVYNYYAFIETRYHGVRPKPVTSNLPAEYASEHVIDENGDPITSYETYVAEEYEEPFFSGFCYKRVLVKPYLDERAQKQMALKNRRTDLELAEEELELERLEREIGLRSGSFDKAHLDSLIDEAKRVTDREAAIRQAEAQLNARSDVDIRQKEIILQYMKKAIYR